MKPSDTMQPNAARVHPPSRNIIVFFPPQITMTTVKMLNRVSGEAGSYSIVKKMSLIEHPDANPKAMNTLSTEQRTRHPRSSQFSKTGEYQ